MIRLLFLFILLVTIQLQAQSTMISGKVVIDDSDEVINLEGLSITNLTTHSRTIADAKGLFSIKVNVDDELVFEYVGIQTRQLKITEAILKKGFVTIHLNVEVIELSEANISKLNKDELKNLGKEKSFQEATNDKMGISSTEFKVELNLKQNEAMVNRTISQVGGVSLTGLFGILTKSHKKIKTTKSIQKTKEDHIIALRQFYTTDYFVNDLKIPEGKINEFLDYCYSNFELLKLLKDNNYDELLFTIEEQAPLYLKKINENK